MPKSLVVIGAGAVGVEFASVFKSFGAEVTILEALPRIVPVEDEDISKELLRLYKKRGIDVHVSAKVDKVEKNKDGVLVHFTKSDGKPETKQAEKVLVAVGRAPRTYDAGLDKTNIQLDRGFIPTNEWMETTEPGIYAIGDIVAGLPQLAHVGAMAGLVVAAKIAGKYARPVRRDRIPGCTYTDPQIGIVGLTEAQAKEKGYQVKVGKFPFVGNSKATILDSHDGFVKVVADAKYGEILGVHIIGPGATEIIAECVTAMELEATVEDMMFTIHAHPTLSREPARRLLQRRRHGHQRLAVPRAYTTAEPAAARLFSLIRVCPMFVNLLHLGRVPYAEGLAIQQQVVAARKQNPSPTRCCCSSIRRSSPWAATPTAPTSSPPTTCSASAASSSTRSIAAATSPTTAPASWSATPSSICAATSPARRAPTSAPSTSSACSKRPSSAPAATSASSPSASASAPASGPSPAAASRRRKSPPSASTSRRASPRTASPSTSPPICATSSGSSPAASPTARSPASNSRPIPTAIPTAHHGSRAATPPPATSAMSSSARCSGATRSSSCLAALCSLIERKRQAAAARSRSTAL